MKQKGKLGRFRTAIQMELSEHKSSFTVYMILRSLVIIIGVTQFLCGNYQSSFMCLLTLILLMMPSFMQLTLRVELPTMLEIILLLFIFAAQILGELFEFYILFPYWDTMLHTLNGFLAAAIGFSLVSLLNESDRLVFHLSPMFMAIVAFSFSMTIGVLWEMFEFAMDQWFSFDMQKDTIIQSFSTVVLDPAGGNSPYVITGIQDVAINGESLNLGGYLDIGLIDTMWDLIVNFIGAAVFSVLGAFYVKKKGNSIISNLIPTKKDEDKDYLSQVMSESDG